MTAFVFDSPPVRVVFAPGAIERVLSETQSLGARRIMIVATPGRRDLVESVRDSLGELNAGIFTEARVHAPEAVVDAALAAAREAGADCLVAIGGGSAIGIAKGIARETSLPIVAVPTTYGGSEMTPIFGMTQGGIKQTGRDPRVQPGIVIYDPELTLSLPAATTANSGMNALAHCMEALYAPDRNALTTAAARQGLLFLFDALPVLADSPLDLPAREAALQGAWLAGFALGRVQMGLHHKLCHAIGGLFDLPHAETHAALLPYTCAYNRQALPSNEQDLPERLLSLARACGAAMSLSAIGFPANLVAQAAEVATRSEYPNPIAVTRDGVATLLRAAVDGDESYVRSSD